MQLIDRTINTLLLLSKEPDGLTLTELANKLKISTSATHRILKSLMEHHFVLQVSNTKKYLLGYRVLTLGNNIQKDDSLAKQAKKHIIALAEKTGETVAICDLEGSNIICLDFIESKSTSSLMVRRGVAMPPHTTSAGKAILAFKPTKEVERIYYEFNKDSSNFDFFIKELELVRKNGYAISNGELQIGVFGIAAPIMDSNGLVVASVSITGIKKENNINEESINFLKNTAQEISRTLGAY